MGTTAAGPGNNGLAAMKTMQMSTNLNLQLDPSDSRPLEIPKMQMGDVSGIRGLKVERRDRADTVSLMAQKRDVALEKHSVLLVVPLEGTFPRAASNPAVAHPPNTPPGHGASAVTSAIAAPAPEPTPPVVPTLTFASRRNATSHCLRARRARRPTLKPASQSNSSGMGTTSAKSDRQFRQRWSLAYLGPRETSRGFQSPHPHDAA